MSYTIHPDHPRFDRFFDWLKEHEDFSDEEARAAKSKWWHWKTEFEDFIIAIEQAKSGAV